MPLAPGAHDGHRLYSVYYDDAGRTGPFENGFPWASYPDCDPECESNWWKTDTGEHWIVPDHIDYDDQKVLAFLGTGKTDGVFQLESAGMKNFMKELKPQSLEDIIAGISLYRPGPMDFIPQYIRGKNHPDSHSLRLPAAGANP